MRSSAAFAGAAAARTASASAAQQAGSRALLTGLPRKSGGSARSGAGSFASSAARAKFDAPVAALALAGVVRRHRHLFAIADSPQPVLFDTLPGQEFGDRACPLFGQQLVGVVRTVGVGMAG